MDSLQVNARMTKPMKLPPGGWFSGFGIPGETDVIMALLPLRQSCPDHKSCVGKLQAEAIKAYQAIAAVQIAPLTPL
jgi:hypothetical protein